MKKFLLIFLFLFFGCNSSTPGEKDGFYTSNYLNGNIQKTSFFVNGNLSSITWYYNNSSNSIQMDMYATGTIHYDQDGSIIAIRDYYLNGNTKSHTKFNTDGEMIASVSWDSSNDNMWGYDKTSNWIKRKPFRMKTGDYWNKYCKKDKVNSNHSWDQFLDSNGKLVWRCRGWDNGQFVKNCNFVITKINKLNYFVG